MRTHNHNYLFEIPSLTVQNIGNLVHEAEQMPLLTLNQ